MNNSNHGLVPPRARRGGAVWHFAIRLCMAKTSRAFRLSDQALDKLDALQGYTGSTQASIVEQALAVYAAFLEHGLPLPGGPAARSGDPARDGPRSDTGVGRDAAAVGGADPRTYVANGREYRFSFLASELPARDSDPCPCGSGKAFSGCHNKDFRLAVKAGLTRRDLRRLSWGCGGQGGGSPFLLLTMDTYSRAPSCTAFSRG